MKLGKQTLTAAGGGLACVLTLVIAARTFLPAFFSGPEQGAPVSEEGPAQLVMPALELGAPVLGVMRELHQPSCKTPGDGGERWVFRAKPAAWADCKPRGRDLELTVDPTGRIVAFRVEARVAEVRTPEEMERFRRAYHPGK